MVQDVETKKHIQLQAVKILILDKFHAVEEVQGRFALKHWLQTERKRNKFACIKATLRFSMVVTRHGAGGSGSRSGSVLGDGTEPVDERLCELIAAEVTRGILDVTPVIFGTVKEVRDPIVIRRWVADIENAQCTSSCPDAEKVDFASCMLRDRAQYWCGEVTSQVGAAVVAEMTWVDFVQRFDLEFEPNVKVQRLVREFQELQQTNDIVTEITAKWKPEQAHTGVGQAKKPKTSNSSSKGQQVHGQCAKCGRSYGRVCQGIGLVDCPRLQGGRGAVAALASATMRIIDGRVAKADALAVKSRTFLVNGMSAHVLFDSGATRSFVSLALSKKFWDELGTLDSLLKVEIVDDHTLSVVRVYRDYVLNVLGERFRIDLVPIPLQGLKVIVRMDWLGANMAMIDCEHQLVKVQIGYSGREALVRADPLFSRES
ncbi:uncharacterized protein LOC128126006 [Lactuca sativa]|uniref:uncharacterized protein LOC128126006 n=1 Tax=Lactuca sativa TaxID=4236 RepID=UPI0022AFCF44|nr:uncharacterized protein LOC128126006 [Lactuca sativa]